MESVSYTKKALTLVFSFSILSSFILFCSSLLPLVVCYFQNTNKNHMFLICNGILGFILMISGLTTTTRPTAPKECCYNYHVEDHQRHKNIMKDFENQQREILPIEISSEGDKTNIEFQDTLALVTTKEAKENDELLIKECCYNNYVEDHQQSMSIMKNCENQQPETILSNEISSEAEIAAIEFEDILPLVTTKEENENDELLITDGVVEVEEQQKQNEDMVLIAEGDGSMVECRHEEEYDKEFKKKCDDFIKMMKSNMRESAVTLAIQYCK